MLDYILELTERIFPELNKLSPKDKDLVNDQVSFALKQTKAYINSTRTNNTDKSSTILSNIWQRTSMNIKKIKNDSVKQLAEIIEEKSKYWSDPDTYDKTQFDKYDMRLNQVELTLNNLCK